MEVCSRFLPCRSWGSGSATLSLLTEFSPSRTLTQRLAPTCTPTSAGSAVLSMLRKGKLSALCRGPRTTFVFPACLAMDGDQALPEAGGPLPIQTLVELVIQEIKKRTHHRAAATSSVCGPVVLAGSGQETVLMGYVRHVLTTPALQRALALFHNEVSFYPACFSSLVLAQHGHLSSHFLLRPTLAGFCSFPLKTLQVCPSHSGPQGLLI